MSLASYKDLRVYQHARSAANEVYELAKRFPKWELFILTNQILRSSRSVRSNLVEAWRRRRSRKYFLAKLNDAETEAAETQEWLVTAVDCHYVTEEQIASITEQYDHILAQIGRMQAQPEKWLIPKSSPKRA